MNRENPKMSFWLLLVSSILKHTIKQDKIDGNASGLAPLQTQMRPSGPCRPTAGAARGTCHAVGKWGLCPVGTAQERAVL